MYQLKAKQLVMEYINIHKDYLKEPITIDDIHVVWFCETPEHSKILLGTSLPDGLYYEVTFDKGKSKLIVVRMGII